MAATHIYLSPISAMGDSIRMLTPHSGPWHSDPTGAEHRDEKDLSIPDLVLSETNSSFSKDGPETPRRAKLRRRRKRNIPLLAINMDRLGDSLRQGLIRPSKIETEAFEKLKSKYKETLDFRDLYFDHHSADRATHRAMDISNSVCESLEAIQPLECSFKPKNAAWYIAYRALIMSIDPSRAKEALEALHLAVRRLSTFPDLWIALGECYWELGSFSSSISAFERALILDTSSSIPLLKLSCCMRLLIGAETDVTEKCRLLVKIVQTAREVVLKSPEDGESLYGLANALLVYYNVQSKPDLISEALQTFRKAEECPVIRNKADFYFNYGVARLLNGDYTESVALWRKASVMEPTWVEPRDKIQGLFRHLSAVNDLVLCKDRTLRRRIKLLAESVPTKNLSIILEDINIPGRKPYKIANCTDLQLGANTGVLVHGKIYSTPHVAPDASRLILIVDSTANYIPAVIYNLGIEFSMGGSISVPDPFVCQVNVDVDGKKVEYRYIRVNEPWKMFHNFIKVPRKQCAQTVVTISPVKTDV